MNEVNIREARRRLSSLLDAAQKGESTVITRYGHAVARIDPVEPPPEATLPDRSAFRSRIKIRGKAMSKVVTEQRKKARY